MAALVLAGALGACRVYDDGRLSGTGQAPAMEPCPDADRNAICDSDETTPPDPPDCDPACDDGIECTRDYLAAAATPEACPICKHEPIAQAQDGDGCCPLATTALEDDDCAPVCGNHVIEPNESCDPCPSSCDDGNRCTTDKRSASGGPCNVTCTHKPVPAAETADQCCAPDADRMLDPDCAECGNGVIEAGEVCDGGGACSSRCTARLHESLLHRYVFDGRGRIVRDIVGQADGTLINTELDGSGTLDLAGGSTNQYVALPERLISPLSGVTIEVWLTWRGGSLRQRIFDFGMNTRDPNATRTGEGTTYFYVTPRGAGEKLAAHLNLTALAGDVASDVILEGPAALEEQRVHQVVATFGDGTLQLYVDATSQGSRAEIRGGPAQIDDRNLWIGRANFPEDELNALVHEVRIYGQVLSPAEVTASFTVGADL